MARRVTVQLIDDLDGTSDSGIETIQFGLDGATYEMELSIDNRGRLLDSLTEFVTHARPARGEPGATDEAGGKQSANGRGPASARAIRDWAKAQGYELSNRGRLPHNVVSAFEAAHEY